MNSGEHKTIQIVIAGAPGSGKLTSLRSLIRRAPASSRGKLLPVKSNEDVLLTIDLSTGLVDREGEKVYLKLWTVNGEVNSRGTWQTLLKRADGVFFLVDFRTEKFNAALEMLSEVQGMLDALGRDRAAFPWVFGVIGYANESGAVRTAKMKRLNPEALPAFDTVATTGKGLFRGLKVLLDRIVARQNELSGVKDPLDGVVPDFEDETDHDELLTGYSDPSKPVQEEVVKDEHPTPEPVIENVEKLAAERIFDAALELQGEPQTEDPEGEFDKLPGFAEVELTKERVDRVEVTTDEPEATDPETGESSEPEPQHLAVPKFESEVVDSTTGPEEQEPAAEPQETEKEVRTEGGEKSERSWSRPEFALSPLNRSRHSLGGSATDTPRQWEQPAVMLKGVAPAKAAEKPVGSEEKKKAEELNLAPEVVSEDPRKTPSEKEENLTTFRFPDVHGPSERVKNPDSDKPSDSNSGERGDMWRRLARNIRDKKD